jgi:Tol biopolymer transport system component
MLTSGGFLSPAGDRIAFVAFDAEAANARLWLRTLSEPGAQALPGTEGASLPFWSPDGRQIGFFAGGRLKVIDTAGGIVRTLATIDGGTPSGGAWSSDDTILYAGWRSGLVATSAAGGDTRQVTTLDSARNEASHRRPQFLPGGRRFLYYVDSVDPAQAGTYNASLDTAERTRIAPSRAVYAAPGYLLSVEEGVLLARSVSRSG